MPYIFEKIKKILVAEESEMQEKEKIGCHGALCNRSSEGRKFLLDKPSCQPPEVNIFVHCTKAHPTISFLWDQSLTWNDAFDFLCVLLRRDKE
jgi:hypothetical protein